MTRIVAFGQRCAGDDAVGLEIAERIRARAPSLDVRTLEDPIALVDLVAESRVVLVDAVLGSTPGTVHALRSFRALRHATTSTHGLSVADALALAAAFHGEVAARVAVVGVEIAEARRGVIGLSPEVARAVDEAADAAVALAAG